MIIKRICLNNFRQYKGRQEVEFSTDNDRNVTVILGANTSGKTTLIQAFNWCLYERTNFKTKELINSDIAHSLGFGTQEIYVEVDIIHDGRLYIIRRSQGFGKNGYSERLKAEPCRLKIVYKEENGETQEVSSVESKSVIERILPERLSDYFFFAGEHINEINSKGNVVDAVRGLMGLDVISNAVDHFNPAKPNSVISKLRNSLDLLQDTRSGKLRSDIEEEKNKLEGFTRRKTEVKGEIEALKDKISEKDAIILANQSTKIKQQEKLQLERDIQIFEERLKDAEKRILRDFMHNAYKFFAKPLYEKAVAVIAEAKQDGEGIPEMHAKAIDYILGRGKCICGCDLTDNQGAVRKLEYEKSLLPPAHLGTLIRTYHEKCESYNADADDYASVIEEDYKNIRLTANLIDEKKTKLAEVSKEIIGNINVGKIEEERAELKRAIERNEQLLFDIERKIGESNSNIANFEKAIAGLVVGTEKNARIKKSIEYALAIYEWFKESYDRHEKEVKEGLHESIKRLFTEMYHGQRMVEVDNNYRIILKVDNGNGKFMTDLSSGLETVKNFAFVTGLVDLARRKAKQKDEDGTEYSTEPYPLVMDAPFSNTDEKHIENISKAIPQIAEQVILIVMEKDWIHAKSVIEKRVGKAYKIEKHSETSSTLRGE